MTTTYTIALDSNDDGGYVADLTPFVLEARWRLGMAAPFESVAAVSVAEIALQNADALPTVERGLSLRITSDDGTTTRTHFAGAVRTLEYRDNSRRLMITAECPLRTLTESRVQVAPLVNARSDTAIDAILRRVPFRLRYLDGAFMVGVVGHAELGVNTRTPTDAARVNWSLQTGETRLAYVGDTWDGGVIASDAVREVVAAERGRFFVTREGVLTLFNRHELLLRNTPAASFTDDMDGLTLTYGADTVSRVTVTARPRSLGGVDDVLWTLGTSQALAPSGVLIFTARFRGDAETGVGALSVRRPRPFYDFRFNTASDGSGDDITASVEVSVLIADMGTAAVRVVNYGDQVGYLLAGMVLRGQPLITANPLTVTARDGLSATRYGGRTLALDLPGLTDAADAGNIARYELTRRNSPRIVPHTLTLTSVSHRPQILARTLFDRVTITETRSGYSADAFIVAENHHLSEGGARHTVRWTLEPTNPGAFWVLGVGRLGDDTRVGY